MDPMGSTDSNSLSLVVEETSIYVVKMPTLEPDTVIHLEMVGGFNWMMNQIFTLGKCFFHHFHPLKNGGFWSSKSFKKNKTSTKLFFWRGKNIHILQIQDATGIASTLFNAEPSGYPNALIDEPRHVTRIFSTHVFCICGMAERIPQKQYATSGPKSISTTSKIIH